MEKSQLERVRSFVGFVRTNLSRFNPSPLRALDVQADDSQSGKQNDRLQSNLFALVVLWFGSPMEEGDDILGHLRGRSGSAWERK